LLEPEQGRSALDLLLHISTTARRSRRIATRQSTRGEPQTMKRMVLMTYTPRDLYEEEYAQFIREIDYPNFRQCPYILDYSCWRIVESVQGKELFTHFDCMEVRDFADWEQIISWPSVQDNIRRWTQEWSRHGLEHPDPAENPKISFCERYWG
jgi:hypothetical protein